MEKNTHENTLRAWTQRCKNITLQAKMADDLLTMTHAAMDPELGLS